MNKILSIFISTILIISGLCISVSAGGVSQQPGAYTEGIYTYDVESEKVIIKSCDKTVSGEVTVPATLGGYPVCSIGYGAFIGCNLITSIILPDSVETIIDAAFACEKLERIDLGNGVKTIGYAVFEGCYNLKSLNIPKSVTKLEEGFIGIVGHNLDTITVEEGNTVYHSKNNCLIETATKTLILVCKNSELPNDGSVENIKGWTFQDVFGLKSVTVPNSVKKIISKTFTWGNDDLKAIVLPESVAEIEEYAIEGCYGLTSLTIANKNVILADNAIVGCENVTIKCYENSTAHTYATKNNIPVEFIVDKVEEAKPEIIEGKDVSYKKDGKTELTIKSNADFIDFESVLVDGKEIDKNNYTVKEGSTVVTLKADYLNTLSAGKHTVGIKSKNGIAETTITVANADTITSSQTSNTTSKPAENKITSPKTGDTSIIPIVLLMIISISVSTLSIKKLRCNN